MGLHLPPKKPSQICVLLVAVLWASVAPADPPLPPGEEKRPTPDYDGRPDEPATPGETALWIPRIVLYPAYLTTEYLIRRPVGVVVTLAERYHLRARWNDLFTFGPQKEIGLFPSAYVDLGLHPTVGAHFYWDNILPHNRLSARVLTGGARTWTARASWVTSFGGERTFDVLARFSRRPDRSFYGLGPRSEDFSGRYDEQRVESRVRLTYPLVQHTTLQTYVGQRWVVYDAERGELSDVPLSEAIATGRLQAPPALEDGFLATFTGIRLAFDNRAPRSVAPVREEDFAHRSSSGIGASARVEHHTGFFRTRALPDDLGRRPEWLDYGAMTSGWLDLTGTQRTLELTAMVRFTDSLPASNPVPFTEQASLGGSQPLRGFSDRRLVDKSAAALTLRYLWPVDPSFWGNLHYAVGNVFGQQLEGFSSELLRSSFGIGVSTTRSEDPFEILLAFGTRTFEDGGAVENVRLVFGASAEL